MRKFDIFIKRKRLWESAGSMLGIDAKQVAYVAASKYSGVRVKVLPSIIFL